MKKQYTFLFILGVSALFILLTGELMFSTGAPPGKTGSPGDNGANCTDCHAGSTVIQEDWILSPQLSIMGYTPGQDYSIIVAGYKEDALKYGFEATAEDENGNKVGSFTADVIGMTQTISDGKAITHTAMGTIPITDTAIWFFTWTAPPETVGPVTFYAAINAANGDGTNGGDQINLSNFTTTPATAIDDRPYVHNLKIYPNPSTGAITLDGSVEKNNERIEIMNLNGQIVHSEKVSVEAQKVNLSHLEKGIYIVRVGAKSQRLILN